MSDNNGFKIKYLSPENYFYSPYKKRSLVKFKTLGAVLYLMLLAAVPALLYIWGTQTPSLIKAVSSTSTSIYLERGLPDPRSDVKILKNDSYWKISKRVCGKGKYYLSISGLNENKPLYRGDSVLVSCSL